MKNQLLEDIDDSKSRIPAPPVRRVQPVTPPQRALPEQQPPPPQQYAEAAPTEEASGPAHGRAGVWRKRAPAPSPRHAAWTPRPHAPQETQPAPAPEPPRTAARAAQPILPEIPSFSSRAPDWSIPLQPEPPPWTERWGRKALGWSFALGAVLAIAAGGAWMVHETQVESSLAVVADHTQAPPAVLAEAPLPQPEPETAPAPLKLLPPDPVAAAPTAPAPMQGAAADLVATDTAPADAATASALAAAAAAAAAPPVAKKPAVKRTPERRLATAPPVKRSRAETKKPAPKAVRERERERERVLARAPTVPARSVSADQPDPESPLAETLRMCRAAGYHATACLKRGCEATRFGLVCRG